MKQRLLVALWVGISLSACDPNPSPNISVSSDPRVIDGLARMVGTTCVAESHKKSGSEIEELATALSANNMTISTFCHCLGRSFFEPLTDEELKQFVLDSQKYSREVAEYEPWKSKITSVSLRCMAGIWPDKKA